MRLTSHLGSDGHSSTRAVADTLLHATRSHPPDKGHPPKWIENCLRLHAVGFTKPCLSPSTRCALTAPFHPYLCHANVTIGGLLSVALALTQQSKGRWTLSTTVSCRVRTFLAFLTNRNPRPSVHTLYCTPWVHCMHGKAAPHLGRMDRSRASVVA